MGATARILTLSPVVDDREYLACREGCMGHEDTPTGRRHVGMRASLSAKTQTGMLADVDLRAEVHDDGYGSEREVFVLTVAGGQAVELEQSTMHWLLRQWDTAFWSMPPRQSLTYGRAEADFGPPPEGWKPRSSTTSTPSSWPAADRTGEAGRRRRDRRR
uniref:hypothetical protein n=1 Tax=Paractinoplanes polyasparticus TaxID=2856853 RepID=UPI001C853B9F|nr:hypothetical protein [Actinoplanes polyasparticus]